MKNKTSLDLLSPKQRKASVAVLRTLTPCCLRVALCSQLQIQNLNIPHPPTPPPILLDWFLSGISSVLQIDTHTLLSHHWLKQRKWERGAGAYEDMQGPSGGQAAMGAGLPVPPSPTPPQTRCSRSPVSTPFLPNKKTDQNE